MRRLPQRLVAAAACFVLSWLVSGPGASAQKDGGKAKGPEDYELRILRVGDTFQGIRFRRTTGEAWQISVDRWEKIPEAAPVPAGNYDVLMIGTDMDFTAFRWDRATGATWHLKGRRWVKVKEPE